MTRNSKVSRGRLLFTTTSIILFMLLFVKADAFSNSVDDNRITVNPSFIWSEGATIGINPDYINISDSVNDDDFSVIHYIVQEGDTLETISKEFWVPINKLKELNKVWDSVYPWQKLVVSDNEEGIVYVVNKERSLKLFAEFYRLNIDDLMTFNYISDDSEMLYPGQELFVNVSEKKAYEIWLLEKAQPVLPKDEVIKPKTQKKTGNTTKKWGTTQKSWSTWNDSWNTWNTWTTTSWKILSKYYYNPKVSNGFAVGYCTWYAAIQSPHIFKYTDANTQSRPFGGNAVNWYANAKAAGYSVGQTPRAWAIIVYRNLRSSAGHVGIVRSYDASTGQLVVEDMNYAGKFIVTKRIDYANNSKIVGYIYG